VGERESQIVAIARAWIGTPYVHQASLKGVGCDCLGLLRGIWRELYGEEPEDAPPYSLDWAEATGAETLYMALKRHAREVPLADLAPGDVALFRMSPRAPAKHCGVIASRQTTSPLWGGRRTEGEPGGGLNTHGSPHPIRFASLTGSTSPQGGGDSATFIHARQNKRVSEEPLSAFWGSKLAYAFRLKA
jgi:NlpC/P60 family putative phage cell wall peptidase